MSSKRLATALAANRVLFGIGFVLSPGASARGWLGRREARREPTQVFARALGARDVALGLGALRALREGDERVAASWMLGNAIADCTDLIATFTARSELPAPAAAFATGMAAASFAIAASTAMSLGASRSHQRLARTHRSRHWFQRARAG